MLTAKKSHLNSKNSKSILGLQLHTAAYYIPKIMLKKMSFNKLGRTTRNCMQTTTSNLNFAKQP